MNTSSPQSWEKQRFVHSWMRVIRRSEAPGTLSNPSRTKPTRLSLPSYRAQLSPSPRAFRRSPGKPAARTFFISVVNSRIADPRRVLNQNEMRREERSIDLVLHSSDLQFVVKLLFVFKEENWPDERKLIYRMTFGFLLARKICLGKAWWRWQRV